MKKLHMFAWSIVCCLSLTSCQSEAEQPTRQTTTQSKSNIVYLDQLITKSDEASKAFNDIINTGNVVVDFYADWCGPCRNLGASIEKIASQFPNVTFLKVNVDQFRSIATGVRSIPVIRLYKNGRQVYTQTGALSASALEKLLRKTF